MQLHQAMQLIKQLDDYINRLRRAMRHVHPHSVDAIRHNVNELELIKEAILDSDLSSNENLDSLVYKIRECVRGCLRPVYTNKPQVLPRPEIDEWKPPVTVTGVNLIFVVDISDSMFERGGLNQGGRMRNLLVNMAKEINRYATQAQIPAKVSLVGYADPTDATGRNRPTFWTITLNKRPVSELENAFNNINRTGWARGSDHPESGMTALYKTIDLVMDKSIVNGKPVENSVILVSDERQKMKNSQHPPHHLYPNEVSLSEITQKFNNLGIKNRYALIPMTRGYIDPNKGVIGNVNYNVDVRKFFRQSKEYWNVSSVNDVRDWIVWTLDPSSAPQ